MPLVEEDAAAGEEEEEGEGPLSAAAAAFVGVVCWEGLKEEGMLPEGAMVIPMPPPAPPTGVFAAAPAPDPDPAAAPPKRGGVTLANPPAVTGGGMLEAAVALPAPLLLN